MQTKTFSLIEVALGTTIGFIIALLTQVAVFPLFGIHIPIVTDLWITAVFTVVSLIRQYFVRRLFNYLGLRKRGAG